METVYVEDITEGGKITGFYLVRSKRLLLTQTGNSYLALNLQDKTGQIEGRVWERAEQLNGQFSQGDVVKVRATAETFRDVLQLRITQARRCGPQEVEPTAFLPASAHDPQRMLDELRGLLNTVQNPHLKQLADLFFYDEAFVDKFSRAPGAKGIHHVYLSGLLEHTLSVMKLCNLLASFYQGVDRDLLLTAAALHDIGKMEELTTFPRFDYTDEGRLIGHTVMAVEWVRERLARLPEFPPLLHSLLVHAIISHAGEPEYGAIQRPKTLEALILHHADDTDAKVNIFQQFIAQDTSDQSWTAYHRVLERFIYKGPPPEGRADEALEESGEGAAEA